MRNNNIMKTYSGWRKKSNRQAGSLFPDDIIVYMRPQKFYQIISTADKQRQSGWV